MIDDAFAFLAPLGTYLTTHNTALEQTAAFKDHWQFPLLLDALSRKDQHHLILNTSFSRRMQLAYFKALLHSATPSHYPLALADAAWLYVDGHPDEQEKLLHDLPRIQAALDERRRYWVLILRYEAAPFFNQKMVETIWQHPYCRLIFVAKDQPLAMPDIPALYRDHFTCVTLAPPEEQMMMALLKHERGELEAHHQVVIPEALLSQAYALAKRYLSTEDSFEKALLLLDSAAARAGVMHAGHAEKTLTTTLLLTVLSTWTQIPETHLLFNQFSIPHFLQNMRERVFGQEGALHSVGQQLQHAQAHLKHETGPFCTFLFAGSPHVGKKTMGLALADHLFRQINLFYCAQVAKHQMVGKEMTLATLKFKRATDHRYFSFKALMTQTPYAIVYIQDVELASLSLLDELQHVIDAGFWHDTVGHEYDCRQMILILSTQWGGEQLAMHMQGQYQAATAVEESSLLQLVLNRQGEQSMRPTTHTAADTDKALTQIVRSALSTAHPLLQTLPIVPFVPLTKEAIENIMRIKLKSLSAMLAAHHDVQFGYAPEVIRYLTTKMQHTQQQASLTIEKILQPLYALVEQAITNTARHHDAQLFLRLNETGEVLRCEWIKGDKLV